MKQIVIDQAEFDKKTYHTVLVNAGYTELTPIVWVEDQSADWVSYLITMFDLVDPFGYSIEL